VRPHGYWYVATPEFARPERTSVSRRQRTLDRLAATRANAGRASTAAAKVRLNAGFDAGNRGPRKLRARTCSGRGADALSLGLQRNPILRAWALEREAQPGLGHAAADPRLRRV